MELYEDEIDGFDITLALKLAKIVHDKCKDVPHDIGMLLGYEVVKHYASYTTKVSYCGRCGLTHPINSNCPDGLKTKK